MMRKAISIIIFLLVSLTGFLLYRTIDFHSRQKEYPKVEKADISDSAKHRLARAIGIPTISSQTPDKLDSTSYLNFDTFLQQNYPMVHSHLSRKVFHKFSYLYIWQGSEAQLKPIVLVAQLNVVPVAMEDLALWTFPPFSGQINNGSVWGRGALEGKVGVVGILEAVEHLLNAGFQPKRTVYLAFGHDKENGVGARAMVDYLKEEMIWPEMVLGEGSAISHGLVPGVLTDVAIIGIAEKSIASIELSVTIDDKEARLSNSPIATEVLTQAITRLQMHPFDLMLTDPVRKFITYIGPEMRFQDKLLFANSDIFKNDILEIFQQSATCREMVQNTMETTSFHNEIKENMLTRTASTTIEFSLLPGTSNTALVEQVNGIINDSRVRIEIKDDNDQTYNISSADSWGFETVSRSIKEVFPNVTTVPNLLVQPTDTRFYEEICNDVYRFIPIQINQDNISTIRGVDENISVKQFEDVVRFYIRLIQNAE